MTFTATDSRKFGLCLQSIEAFNEISGNLNKPVNPELEVDMLKEEVMEYLEGALEGNDMKVRDALADIFVVLYGTILKNKLKAKFLDILEEVCASNMSKFCKDQEEAEESVISYMKQGIATIWEYNEKYKVYIIKRTDGKIMKSINFVKPRL
jgi:predicted HAD superfamily Cof-like phosphohydrolase